MRSLGSLLLVALAGACGGRTHSTGTSGGPGDASVADAADARDASSARDAAAAVPLGADAGCVPLAGCSSATDCQEGDIDYGCQGGGWVACLQKNAPGMEYGSCSNAGSGLCPVPAAQNGQGCDVDASASCAYPLPPTGACSAWECTCVVLSSQVAGPGPGAWLCNEASCEHDAGENPCVDAGAAQGAPCPEEGLVCNPGGPSLAAICLCAAGRWACANEP